MGKCLNLLSLVAPKRSGRILLSLLLKPRPKPIKTNMLNFLAEAANFSFEEHGETYAGYHWEGTGPSILLLHGWESNASRWRPLIKKLRQENYNIYAMDAPGHGNSTGTEFTPIKFAEAAHHIITEAKIEILLGHSAGGFASLYYLSSIPNKLKCCVILAPTYSMEDVFTGMKSILGLSTRAISNLRSHFIQVYDVIPKEFNSANFVKDLTLPSLLVHDEEDRTLPVAGSDMIAKTWKNCTYKRTAGYGHRLRDKAVDDMIIDFLRTVI